MCMHININIKSPEATLRIMEFKKNNLERADSPYLLQHKDNPIWWQQWSKEVLEYAKRSNKPIFVSVGYSTCHWCHVMAHEAFVDSGVAQVLNEHFVCIKVDREQRPDIDQYLMSFLVNQQGSGGWPLHVFLTPEAQPFFATTYIPVVPQHGMPAFTQLVQSLLSYYEQNRKDIAQYRMPTVISRQVAEHQLLNIIRSHYAPESGFGKGAQFPPHSTLLFLLHYADRTGDADAIDMAEETLDIMALGGLHDHLQGGFFRYCTDASWRVPHFEKMLYDQALMLWEYSASYKLLGRAFHKMVVEKLITCIEETFEDDGLYYSSHDADTSEGEGTTYLWTYDELQSELTREEFKRFASVYEISKEGNVDGKTHLLRTKKVPLAVIEEKLLRARQEREQPTVDRKIITSWNALLGIGFLMACRYTQYRDGLRRAKEIFSNLLEQHYIGGKLHHSSVDGKVQEEEFLEDYAAMLLLCTYLHEETGNYEEILRELREKVKKFRDHGWNEANNADFMPIPAQSFDHPTPSSVAMVEFGLLRARILLEEEYTPQQYRAPLQQDFLNIASFMANSHFHKVTARKQISWKDLPLSSIQIRGDIVQDCFDSSCTRFDSEEELVQHLKMLHATRQV
jgi:uncharacterized protein